NDSLKAIAAKDSANHYSNKGRIFLGGGIGQSKIIIAAYIGSQDQLGTTTQSLVYNGNVDYCLVNNKVIRNMTIGVGVAYQTATGNIYLAAPSVITYPGYYTEYLTRLNISLRVLWDAVSTKGIEMYYGIRCGLSYWTDEIPDAIQPVPSSMLAMGQNRRTLPSIQFPIGARLFFSDFLALNLELALGTPYFVEGGLTFRF
ncbi:MAG TPA: hypothetical protein VK890_12215, partial [Bacteroidia bacterium]|nr:hypothetical protein [Bacteroidia bacterium]